MSQISSLAGGSAGAAGIGLPPGAGAGYGAGESLSVSQQFESLFLQMMIKQMRQTGAEEGLFPGDTSDTYGALFDQMIADHMAKGKGVGIASYLEQNASTEELKSTFTSRY